jgi:hypothetical protein
MRADSPCCPINNTLEKLASTSFIETAQELDALAYSRACGHLLTFAKGRGRNLEAIDANSLPGPVYGVD